MRRKNGFTLVELLVVIAIMAILLTLILPTLGRAKDAAKQVLCMTNQKSLSHAWIMYADDNDDRLCSPCPGWTGKDLECSWVAWAGGWPNNWTPDQWEFSITEGALWPYTDQVREIYRCPSGEVNEQITYAGFAAMGWKEPLNRASDGEIIQKITNIPQPTERAVFIDEGKLTPHFYSVYYNEEKWWDQPPNRHNEGVTMSFADAHAEYWKWQDPRTLEMCDMTWGEFVGSWHHVLCPDNADLYKLRRAAWGNLGSL